MKWVKSLALVLALAVSSYSYADTSTSDVDGYSVDGSDVDGYDVFFDALFLRPMGLVGTIVGTGLFIGLSPLVAISSIPEPHDAFEKLASTLVVKPAKYTFVRPVGDYDYNEGL